MIQYLSCNLNLILKRIYLYFIYTLFICIYVGPVVGGSGWANGYKCPTGSGDTVFHGDLGYDLEEAKEICAKACEDDYHCKFGQLYFNFGQLDNQKYILKGNDCGLNWWSNRVSTHYVYQKG